MISGWLAPADDLVFPDRPLVATAEGHWYDVDGNGSTDFAVLAGPDGRLDRIAYDDDEDGSFDRSFVLDEYPAESVPHLILLVDSLPYRVVSERYAAGEWRWFHPPRKVIPPFPSLSEVIFSDMLHAPPLGGNVERYYDRRAGDIRNLWVSRAFGYQHPWQRRLDCQLDSYLEVGMSYLNPRPWYAAELSNVRRAVDDADHPVVIAYVVSSSAMVSRHGAEGLDECLDRIDKLCLQLLYERSGAIKITIVSDHGHNLRPSQNFPVEDRLRQAGFHPTDAIEDKMRDVVPEIDGLVTYFGVHTARPAAVADALLACEEVELAISQDGEKVCVRSRTGTAFIEHRGGRFRYSSASGDPLRYGDLVRRLHDEGCTDAGGFISDGDWFLATVDLEFPDGPRRLWDAFHGQVVNPPQVMFTLHDGWCAGLKSMESWIDMMSTHGSLNQINSDAVLLTMIGSGTGPLRTRDVLPAVEPGFVTR